MKYIKIKEIFMKEDKRESNILLKDSEGKPIKHKQSKCTCNFLLEDKEGENYIWVVENESLAEAIKQIGLNEEKKYNNTYFSSNGKILGRYLFFLSWLYEFYEEFLTHFGFEPKKEDLEKARRFKNGKFKD
jgi:hypothetical protein